MLKKTNYRWDWVAGICLILIVFLSVYSLELTYWTYDLNRVTTLAIVGLSIGLLLGLSSFSKKSAIILSGLYGIAFIFLIIVISLNDSSAWLERSNAYLLRFNISINQLVNNIPLEDGILFLTISGSLYFFLSINLGFRFIRNYKPGISFIIIVFFYYLIQFYLPITQRNYLIISIYSLLIIIYSGSQFFLTKKNDWDLKGIKANKEASTYFSKIIFIFSLSLILISWGIPLIIQNILNNITDVTYSHRSSEYSNSWEIIRNFFYPLRQQSGFGEGYLPEVLALGNSRSLKDEEALIVNVSDEFYYPYRFYWKGRIYDFYENGLWKSKDAEIQHFTSIDLEPYLAPTTSPGLFSIIYKYPREIIFAPQIALRIERQADIAFFPIGEDKQDVLSIVDNQLIHRDERIRNLG